MVRVEDGTGYTTMTLFNKEAEQLVGVPLQKILADQQEVQTIPLTSTQHHDKAQSN